MPKAFKEVGEPPVAWCHGYGNGGVFYTVFGCLQHIGWGRSGFKRFNSFSVCLIICDASVMIGEIY